MSDKYRKYKPKKEANTPYPTVEKEMSKRAEFNYKLKAGNTKKQKLSKSNKKY
jgi:hypothetical protein